MTNKLFANVEYAKTNIAAVGHKHLHVLTEKAQEDHDAVANFALYDAKNGVIFARFEEESEVSKFFAAVSTTVEGVELEQYWSYSLQYSFLRLDLDTEGWSSEQFAIEQHEGSSPTELPLWLRMFLQDDGSWVTCYDYSSEPNVVWPELARLPRMNEEILSATKKREVANWVIDKLTEELKSLSRFDARIGYRLGLDNLYRLYHGVQTLSCPAWAAILGPKEADWVCQLKSQAEARVQQACWGAEDIEKKDVSIDDLFDKLEPTGAEFADWLPEWVEITTLFTERQLICALLFERGRIKRDEYDALRATMEELFE